MCYKTEICIIITTQLTQLQIHLYKLERFHLLFMLDGSFDHIIKPNKCAAYYKSTWKSNTNVLKKHIIGF